jgi:hypothetical protein
MQALTKCAHSNPEHTLILHFDRISDIDEFSVLENEEFMLFRQSLQTSDCVWAKVLDYVDVGFQDGDVRPEDYIRHPPASESQPKWLD